VVANYRKDLRTNNELVSFSLRQSFVYTHDAAPVADLVA